MMRPFFPVDLQSYLNVGVMNPGCAILTARDEENESPDEQRKEGN